MLTLGISGAPAIADPGRVVHADVVALDQLLVYNRFGSFNPFGMIFALRRDVSEASGNVLRPDADRCGDMLGTEAGTGALRPGKVRLKDCKRPRPLVLRVNAGDILEITLTNLLREDQPGISGAFAEKGVAPGTGFCGEDSAQDAARAPVRPDIRQAFSPPDAAPSQCAAAKAEAKDDGNADGAAPNADWPRTRNLSFVIPGLEPVALVEGSEIPGACTGLYALKPGEVVTCRWQTEREGTHLFSSFAAPAGGQGDAGSLGHGLFGALIVEPANSRVFRSQVTSRAFDAIWAPKGGIPHDRADNVSFDAADKNASASIVRAGDFSCDAAVPVLEVMRDCGTAKGKHVLEIVHGDLNAIVVPPASSPPFLSESSSEEERRQWREAQEAQTPFREFVAIFHDELKTYYADPFKQLDRFGQLSGIRDGFGINYGASGVGSAVIANRLGIGPAAGCPECLYEEFFLESWANGDPALLEVFPDDPSNVHHSYLNDKVVFRNFHAGKETHVFHLHAHQWFAGNDAGRGAYLDSQTIGPQQGFTYRIYHGGLERYAAERTGNQAPKGWWDSLGSGNRNRTPGDAIFHCHLYPHFAQGMWALWRVHDVLEDGTRLLPDGQSVPGLSVKRNEKPYIARSGSVGPVGELLAPEPGKRAERGTPVPGLVPLPGFGLPPLPTYSDAKVVEASTTANPIDTQAMPGFPFYIAGKPGHRAPQPPLDMARAEAYEPAGITGEHVTALAGRNYLDGGLPRHTVAAGKAVPTVLKGLDAGTIDDLYAKGMVLPRMLALGDMTSEFTELKLELLPPGGTALERSAMKFHGGGARATVLSDDVSAAPVSGGGAASEVGHGAASNAATLPVSTEAVASEGKQIVAEVTLDTEVAAYPVKRIPLAAARGDDQPGKSPLKLESGAYFAVNGAAPAPGAPFADPCGAPTVFKPSASTMLQRRYDAYDGNWAPKSVAFTTVTDPFQPQGSEKMVADPGLLGFRRFDASAVELKLIVNRAGWHDPQARINVLSGQADRFKGRARSDAEPFFFRSFSGECIEFHHTNETPKKLKLDDFQMAVPTDTIGQHIHLVKFDVTSADGSGNGFNYEDGTFAPDEILERLCIAQETGGIDQRPGETGFEAAAQRSGTECSPSFIKGVSGLQRLANDNIKYFQTTVQRWFADPILSDTGAGSSADRTMRTVFTHDHFGPSNIQQHGFYSALLIEPAQHAVCPLAEPSSAAVDGKTCVPGPAAQKQPEDPVVAQDAQPNLVGARANVFRANPKEKGGGIAGDTLHPDAREYAIAIADFALLYDGTKNTTGVENNASSSPDANGLDRLIAEAKDPSYPKDAEDDDKEIIPAHVLKRHNLELSELDQRLLQKQRREIRSKSGRPIAPPPRPESISQKHHDPYLVNYRNEPVPLRVGTTDTQDRPDFLASPCRVPGALPFEGPTTPTSADSIKRQRPGSDGDLSNLFLSQVHGDPCTPILEGLSGDRILVRLIQGAQEVQHTFMVEGRTARRNVDQHFPSERPVGSEGTPSASRATACATNSIAKGGLATEFVTWANSGIGQGYFSDLERLIAGCDNPMGYLSAQEIGISEHFEFGNQYSSTSTNNKPTIYTDNVNSFSIYNSKENVKKRKIVVSEDAGPGTLDYFYHFGSSDAVWNGAWGLARVYANAFVPDISACLFKKAGQNNDSGACEDTQPVGLRLEGFSELRQQMQLGNSGPSLTDMTLALHGRLASSKAQLSSLCPAGAPVVEAVAVALRAAEVPASTNNASGLRYDGDTLFDRDGMMLVGLEPSELKIEGSLRKQHPPIVLPDRQEILRIVAEKLKNKTFPFVLRVHAGDCIDLMLVNALPTSGGTKQWDASGDAPMPKIVPLNVDDDERQFHGTKTFREWQKTNGRGTRVQIAPSHNVALSVPLPSTGFNPDGTLPVGVNGRQALALESQKVNYEILSYYAGFLWVDSDSKEIGKETAEITTYQRSYIAKKTEKLINSSVALFKDDPCDREQQLTVLGVLMCFSDKGLNQAQLQADIDNAFQAYVRDPGSPAAENAKRHPPEDVQNVLRHIPYAFGALPIRSVGDIISHGVHGLIGTLIVEPKDATFGSKYDPAQIITLPDIASTSGSAYVAKATVPEFTLVWQDGLNLRRRATGQKLVDQDLPGRPVPDCPAPCDDSYDLGEQGVSYRSAPFTKRLADRGAGPWWLGISSYPRDKDIGQYKGDLNRQLFPLDFFAGTVPTPVL